MLEKRVAWKGITNAAGTNNKIEASGVSRGDAENAENFNGHEPGLLMNKDFAFSASSVPPRESILTLLIEFNWFLLKSSG